MTVMPQCLKVRKKKWCADTYTDQPKTPLHSILIHSTKLDFAQADYTPIHSIPL